MHRISSWCPLCCPSPPNWSSGKQTCLIRSWSSLKTLTCLSQPTAKIEQLLFTTMNATSVISDESRSKQSFSSSLRSDEQANHSVSSTLEAIAHCEHSRHKRSRRDYRWSVAVQWYRAPSRWSLDRDEHETRALRVQLRSPTDERRHSPCRKWSVWILWWKVNPRWARNEIQPHQHVNTAYVRRTASLRSPGQIDLP